MYKWFAFYCSSRHEKKVADFLFSRNFITFLPTQTKLKQWSDRKKKVVEPLFKGYIFVWCTPNEIPLVGQTNGIVGPVKIGLQHGFLRENEKQSIERLLATGVYCEVTTLLEEGDIVSIHEGLLKGLTGRVISTPEGQWLYIQIESLHSTLRAKLPKEAIKKIS